MFSLGCFVARWFRFRSSRNCAFVFSEFWAAAWFGSFGKGNDFLTFIHSIPFHSIFHSIQHGHFVCKNSPTSWDPKSTGPGRPSHVPAQRRDHYGGKHLVTGQGSRCSVWDWMIGSSDGKPIFLGNQTIQIYGNLEGFPLMHCFGLVSCNDPCWLGRNKTTMSGWCCTWWANQQKMAIFLAHNEQNEQLARGVQHLPAVFVWKHLGLSCSEDVSFGWKERFFFVEDFGFYTMTFCEVLEVFLKKSPNILLEHFSLNRFIGLAFNLMKSAIRWRSESLGAAWDMLSFSGHQTWPKKKSAFSKIGNPKIFPWWFKLFSTKWVHIEKNQPSTRYAPLAWCKSVLFLSTFLKIFRRNRRLWSISNATYMGFWDAKKRRKKNGRCKWTTDWQKEMRKELWGFWRSLKAKWQILAKALFHLQMFLVGLTSFCWRLLWSTHKNFKNAGMFRGWWSSFPPPFQQDHSVKAR